MSTLSGYGANYAQYISLTVKIQKRRYIQHIIAFSVDNTFCQHLNIAD
ncbi:hypothetical protein [Shewanella youngdeokensis]|uniref:Uncharacterized protein n=1 Tax=Shewanella youngdeokensis TaxID=2999068 RepID=A0ABZ0JZ89_9GAMM|nr:hypothetical protein RGE70_01955 [Shewanella sp. DAU334]